MDEMRFDGRSVIVTGGGRGYGRSHAKLLASRGARVVVADYGVNLDGSGSSPGPPSWLPRRSRPQVEKPWRALQTSRRRPERH